jgi:hypothetical protein
LTIDDQGIAMSDDATRRQLPRFDPRDPGRLTRFRWLPAWALTVVSIFVPLAMGLSLAGDSRRLELFYLRWPWLWAAAAFVMAAIVAIAARGRPGTFRRMWLPRTWTIVIAVAGAVLFAVSIARIAEPPSGRLNVLIFLVCCSTAILLARLVPLKPMSTFVQWIGIVIFALAIPCFFALRAVADQFVDNGVVLTNRLVQQAEAHLRELQDTCIEKWDQKMSRQEVAQRADAVAARLAAIAAGVPTQEQIDVVMSLGGTEHARLANAYRAIVTAAGRCVMPSDDAHRLFRGGQTDEIDRRRFTMRYDFYHKVSEHTRLMLAAGGLRQLAPLFATAGDPAAWSRHLDGTRGALDDESGRLARSFGSHWLGRAIGADTAPPTPGALFGMTVSLDPADSAAAPGGAPEDDDALTLGKLDRWLTLRYDESRRLLGSSSIWTHEHNPWGDNASCFGGWSLQPQRHQLWSPLFDGTFDRPSPATLRLVYTSGVRSHEVVPCDEPTAKDRTARRIWRRLSSSQLPAYVEIDLVSPRDVETKTSLDLDRVASAFVDALEEQGVSEIRMLPPSEGRGVIYRAASGGPFIRVVHTAIGAPANGVRVQAILCDSRCGAYSLTSNNRR